MEIIETNLREIGFVLWGHCQNLLDDPRRWMDGWMNGWMDEFIVMGGLWVAGRIFGWMGRWISM